jgi:hypothetical protein
MAFAQLAFCDSVLQTNEGQVVYADFSASNGLAVRMKKGNFTTIHGKDVID